MCKWVKSGANRIDPCMREIIEQLNSDHIETLGCCCGHGRYPKTVVCRADNGEIRELFSEVFIPRKKRFYIKDADGVYYIPEVVEP